MYDAAFRKKEMGMRDYGDESIRLEKENAQGKA